MHWFSDSRLPCQSTEEIGFPVADDHPPYGSKFSTPKYRVDSCLVDNGLGQSHILLHDSIKSMHVVLCGHNQKITHCNPHHIIPCNDGGDFSINTRCVWLRVYSKLRKISYACMIYCTFQSCTVNLEFEVRLCSLDHNATLLSESL